MNTIQTSVLIIGAGPVGLALAHHLGKAGVEFRQIDAASELSDEPRAVGLDPESLRGFQALDLVEALKSDILFGVTGEYCNGDGGLLFALEDGEPGALGYPFLNGFNQPALVRTLARELSRYPCGSLHFNHRLLDFSQSATGVSAKIEDDRAEPYTVNADYMVACDGGRSTVRSQLNIAMQGESNAQPWLVIDTREEVDDGKKKFRFFCDPVRPGMFLQTPHNNRRWEWMIMPGEDREDFLRDDTIHRLISPFVDISKIDIYRRQVYDFHAIVAEKFQQDRVFLAGDAAHMTPPFAGQGLNSGMRDVANLGWKLVAVLRDGAPGELLDSYEAERRPHAKELIDVALALGAQIQPTDPRMAAERDAAFAQMQQQPGQMAAFQDGLFRALLDRSFSTGAAVNITEDYLSGRMLPQPEVLLDGKPALLDEHLGDGFVILGHGCNPANELDQSTLSPWLEAGTRLIAIGTAEGVSLGSHGQEIAQLFDKAKGNMVLLRPDRFCMAEFDAANATEILSQAAHMLGRKQ